MGQLLSRQTTPSRRQHERHKSDTRIQLSRRERTSNIRFDDGLATSMSSHRLDRTASRTRNATSAQIRARQNPLREVDGNIGAPRRQQKYGRGKTPSEPRRAKDHVYQRPRKATGETQLEHGKRKESRKITSHASKSKSHQARSQPTKECIICTDTRSLHHFPGRPPTQQCTHDMDVCRRCLRTWIQSESSTKIWNEINCPMCATRMQYDDMREFAPREVFRRYDKLTTKAVYDSIPNYRWCIAKGCKSGQVHPPGNARFRCKACQKSHCMLCLVKWHKGETCGEYEYRTNKHLKKQEEAASKKFITETTKKCPGCKRSIEKSFGCDHMTCSKCKHEFCWQCLAPYLKKGIRRVIHKRGCEYHNPEWDSD